MFFLYYQESFLGTKFADIRAVTDDGAIWSIEVSSSGSSFNLYQ
jgi:hypothetical protein